MVKEINAGNLDALCRGGSFLGSGGGGEPDYLRPTVERALAQWGAIPLVSLADLDDEDCIAAICLIGAITPTEQRQKSLKYLMRPVFDLLINEIRKPIKALMPLEIGGTNVLAPFCLAGDIGLPVLDGDLMGRAFPKITMISTSIFDITPECFYIADHETGVSRVSMCSSYEDLEQKARAHSQMFSGSSAALIPLILTGKEAKIAAISETVSHSLRIGQQKSLEDLIQVVQGKIQCRGTIIKWNYELKGGFLIGSVELQTIEGDVVKIIVKNEYLHLLDTQNNTIAETPDIISLLRTSDLSSVLSDQIRVGDEVVCVTCKGPALWYSDRGLALVRPNYQKEPKRKISVDL